MEQAKQFPLVADSKRANLVCLISPRERQVMELISKEYSTKEIAKLLFLSPATVESHRKNLRIKLDCKNMAGVVRRGFELGYLKCD